MTATTFFDIDILFFALSLLAFVLVFIPFPWHLKGEHVSDVLTVLRVGWDLDG